MRISKSLQTEREAAVMSFFFKNPTATIREVNAQLKATYGKAMAAKTIQTIRARVVEHKAAAPSREFATTLDGTNVSELTFKDMAKLVDIVGPLAVPATSTEDGIKAVVQEIDESVARMQTPEARKAVSQLFAEEEAKALETVRAEVK
jgi:hypothetical protein